ncbi:homeobox domain protein [Ceratobasidium sp. AG-Ba]|nr:homeobox domain protein [Ceratobasidium sp. AG-Ba]
MTDVPPGASDKRRTKLTWAQLVRLEGIFAQTWYPSWADKDALAREFALEHQQVNDQLLDFTPITNLFCRSMSGRPQKQPRQTHPQPPRPPDPRARPDARARLPALVPRLVHRARPPAPRPPPHPHRRRRPPPAPGPRQRRVGCQHPGPALLVALGRPPRLVLGRVPHAIPPRRPRPGARPFSVPGPHPPPAPQEQQRRRPPLAICSAPTHLSVHPPGPLALWLPTPAYACTHRPARLCASSPLVPHRGRPPTRPPSPAKHQAARPVHGSLCPRWRPRPCSRPRTTRARRCSPSPSRPRPMSELSSRRLTSAHSTRCLSSVSFREPLPRPQSFPSRSGKLTRSCVPAQGSPASSCVRSRLCLPRPGSRPRSSAPRPRA